MQGRSALEEGEVVGRWEERDKGRYYFEAPPVSVFCLILGAVCVSVCVFV